MSRGKGAETMSRGEGLGRRPGGGGWEDVPGEGAGTTSWGRALGRRPGGGGRVAVLKMSGSTRHGGPASGGAPWGAGGRLPLASSRRGGRLPLVVRGAGGRLPFRLAAGGRYPLASSGEREHGCRLASRRAEARSQWEGWWTSGPLEWFGSPYRGSPRVSRSARAGAWRFGLPSGSNGDPSPLNPSAVQPVTSPNRWRPPNRWAPSNRWLPSDRWGPDRWGLNRWGPDRWVLRTYGAPVPLAAKR